MNMMNRRIFSRRLIAFVATALTLKSIPLSASSALDSRNAQIRRSRGSNQFFIKECQEVYKYWKKSENVTPLEYFQQRDRCLQEISFQSHCRDDIENNRFTVINGLYLPRTEAALFALVGAATQAKFL